MFACAPRSIPWSSPCMHGLSVLSDFLDLFIIFTFLLSFIIILKQFLLPFNFPEVKQWIPCALSPRRWGLLTSPSPTHSELSVCCSVSRCGNTQLSMGQQLKGSDAQCLEPTRVRCQVNYTTTKGTEGNSTLCVQHMTSVIYRALHNSVERNKEPTANITNLNVSASGLSTHCCAYTQCTGTPSHKLSKEQTHSPNPSVDVPPIIRTGLPSNNKWSSLSDTIDPDSLLHDDVLCFDHHATGQKTILVSHLYIACHIHELVWWPSFHFAQHAQTEVEILHPFLDWNLVLQVETCLFKAASPALAALWLFHVQQPSPPRSHFAPVSKPRFPSLRWLCSKCRSPQSWLSWDLGDWSSDPTPPRVQLNQRSFRFRIPAVSSLCKNLSLVILFTNKAIAFLRPLILAIRSELWPSNVAWALVFSFASLSHVPFDSAGPGTD